MPARLALAFSECGAEVFGLCPRGSPISKVASLKAELRYRSIKPLASLCEAIRVTQPDLVVPCDDRVVSHMHALYTEQSTSDAERKLIERSLGDPAGYPIARSRSGLLLLAQRLGVSVPETTVVRDVADLRHSFNQHGVPLVLKADGTWGGSGVRIVHSWAEAVQAYTELRQPLNFSSLLSHLSFHDFFALFPFRGRVSNQLTAQKYIRGSCCNAMFTCWNGEVLDELGVDVLFSLEELGASSVVRTLPAGEMNRAGQLLVKTLGVSGFCGLDFIAEEQTGNLLLIEFNPRATQLGHLEPGGRDSLARTMVEKLTGEMPRKPREVTQETIAFFPQIPSIRAVEPRFVGGKLFHDIPQQDPGLVRELRRPSWNSRHLSAFVYRAMRALLRLARVLPLSGSTIAAPSKIKVGS